MNEEKFKAYLRVQRSGKTNMFDVNNVIMLSGGVLTKEDCADIMTNYRKYSKEYGGL